MNQIVVDLITPNGIKLQKTAIPEEYTVRQIIAELVDQLQLSAFEDGRMVDYTLTWMNQQQKLGMQQTLPEAGVCNGDQLQLGINAPAPPPVGAPPPPPHQGPEPTIPGPPAGGGKIEVILTLLDMSKSVRETLDADRPVQAVLGEIVRKYQLPTVNHLDAAIGYSLRSKSLGRILNGTETLHGAGVPGNDGLLVSRQEIAG
jgi:uncharacterized ubiquitin-like protein YukD